MAARDPVNYAAVVATSGADLSTRASRREAEAGVDTLAFLAGECEATDCDPGQSRALHDPRFGRGLRRPRRRAQRRRIDRVAQGRASGRARELAKAVAVKTPFDEMPVCSCQRRAGTGVLALGLHRNSGVLHQVEQRLPVRFRRLHDEVEPGAVLERRQEIEDLFRTLSLSAPGARPRSPPA